jgi:hypothetical protein
MYNYTSIVDETFAPTQQNSDTNRKGIQIETSIPYTDVSMRSILKSNILTQAWKNTQDSQATDAAKDRGLNFIKTFDKVLEESSIKEYPLASLRCIEETDSTLFYSWIFGAFRIGFGIGNTEDEDYWYFITNKDLEESSKTFYMKRNGGTEKAIRDAVDFAKRNS